MRLARLLADPWTIGAGGFIGALATAGLGLPVVVGAAAAIGGYAVGTAVKAMTARDEAGTPDRPRVELPPRGTDARELYERARAAADELGEIARSQPAGPVQVQAEDVHNRAVDTLEEIARLAGQTVVLSRALGRVDVEQARRDRAHLQQEGRTPSSDAALQAVESQLAVFGRLEGAWRETHARLRAAALGLESLVASLAEVVALASTSGEGPTGSRIRGLADSLDGLRQGLVEAEQASRRALSAG